MQELIWFLKLPGQFSASLVQRMTSLTGKSGYKGSRNQEIKVIFRFHPGVAEKKKNEGTRMAPAGAASCRILALVGQHREPQQGWCPVQPIMGTQVHWYGGRREKQGIAD